MKKQHLNPGAMEITRFRLRDPDMKRFVAANQSIDTWLRQQPGFIARYMAEESKGRVIDVLIWDTVAHGRSAMQRIIAETPDSLVHDWIDSSSVDWSIQPIGHVLENGQK